MKKIKLNYLFIILALTIVLASCHKDRVTPKTGTPVATRAGLYVLNQGNFGANNSTLTYYDYTTKTLTADIYKAANNADLGDTGNDAEIYGSKMYIVINVSNVIDIVNSKTGKLIKQVSMVNAGVGRGPRSVAFYKTNALITSYDGTVAVMDTTSLNISKYITVGRNPEQLVVSNNKLYVANSGGLTFGNPDNTVSVIDLATLTESKKITVIANPVSVVADGIGNIYVLSLGDFDKVLGGLTVIDDKSDAVKSNPAATVGFNVPLAAQGDFVYYATADNKIAVFNVKTQTAVRANFINDGTVITTPYAIAADPLSGELFVSDAKDYSSNGTLYAFDKTGKLEYSIVTGIDPGRIIFVNK